MYKWRWRRQRKSKRGLPVSFLRCVNASVYIPLSRVRVCMHTSPYLEKPCVCDSWIPNSHKKVFALSSFTFRRVRAKWVEGKNQQQKECVRACVRVCVCVSVCVWGCSARVFQRLQCKRLKGTTPFSQVTDCSITSTISLQFSGRVFTRSRKSTLPVVASTTFNSYLYRYRMLKGNSFQIWIYRKSLVTIFASHFTFEINDLWHVHSHLKVWFHQNFSTSRYNKNF